MLSKKEKKVKLKRIVAYFFKKAPLPMYWEGGFFTQ